MKTYLKTVLATRTLLAVAMGLGAVLLTVITAQAVGDSTSSRATLKGLPGVIVGVTGKSCESAGLYESVVKTDVELQLRRTSIKVLESQGAGLEVGVFCYEIRTANVTGYAVHVRLELQQLIWWPHPPPKTATVITWRSDGYLGTDDRATLSENLRKNIRDLVDQFINAWLSVNPIK